LKLFWKAISPVPVSLKRFLALEFVLTFGMIHNKFTMTPYWRSRTDGKLMEPFGQLTDSFTYRGRKSRSFHRKNKIGKKLVGQMPDNL
jgi:hypothetical protein